MLATQFGGVQTGFLANRARACVTRAVFVIFVIFRSGGANPLVFVDRMHIRHFRHFRQNPLFSAGCKNPV